jgi:hypothetical protein
MVLFALGIAAYVVVMNRVLAGPSLVGGITFVNPAPYSVDVRVTDGHRAGWLSLGEVGHRASTRFEGVLDQGDVWIVRFADGEGGELRITREELLRSDWRVQIPEEVEERLQPIWGPPELLAD